MGGLPTLLHGADGYIASQAEVRDMWPEDKMPPTSPGEGSMDVSRTEGDPPSELTDELSQISARMLTKADTSKLAQELRAALREELVGLPRGPDDA
ncbi:Hypothetical predicted protein [Pelobates cultripes]|uniref:Uncharacterized protein n=1 Tax=Pelobates cultripes TaxID=61616 RepID=A0AAD1WNS3_PELCU|nr:Hypothetical predicted protein [Pelobates cultripes]